MGLANLSSMLGCDVNGVTLAVLTEGQVKVRTMAARGIGVTSASGLSTLSGSFGQTALNHALSGFGELMEQRFSLKHYYMIKIFTKWLLERAKENRPIST